MLLDSPEPQDDLVPLVTKVLPDNKVTLESPVSPEARELLVILDVLDLREKPVFRVCLDCPESPERLENKDLL